MARSPQVRLYDLAQCIHRKAVQAYLSEHGQPVDKWHGGVVNRAMEAVIGLDGSAETTPEDSSSLELPDWTTVDLDGGETGEQQNKPIYPLRLLGATGISLVSLHTSEYDNLYTSDDMRSRLPWSSEVDMPNRRLSIQLHHESTTHSRNRYGSRMVQPATIFLRKGTEPVAISDKDMESSASTSHIPVVSHRIVDRVRHDFEPSAVENLSDEACTTTMWALRAATKRLRTF